MKNYYLERAEEKERKSTKIILSSKDSKSKPDEDFIRRCMKLLKDRKK